MWQCVDFLSNSFFMKIETGDDEDELDSSDSESTETLDLSKIKEMRLVPSDTNQCMWIWSFPMFMWTVISLYFASVWFSYDESLLDVYLFFTMAVDTLFDIFCECAELNPEPCDGEWDSFFTDVILYTPTNIAVDALLNCYCCIHPKKKERKCCPNRFSLYLLFVEEEGEEGHNWVFSVDQMEDEARGIDCW